METWVLKNREAFERDVLQGYCLVSDRLFEQLFRIDDNVPVSFSVLRELVGEAWNKGLLWRLKDTAHHVFSDEPGAHPAGLLLDWTLGYIFLEALQLMEDVHQRQYYAPRLAELGAMSLPAEIAATAGALMSLQKGARASMRRKSARLALLLSQSRRLFILYFSARAGHRPLARFLNDNEALIRRIFREDYAAFIASVYGEEPERMHIEAAHSLLESARNPAAGAAVRAALTINPSSREALALKEAHGW